MASRSNVPPCSVTTSRGMICTLAGKSPSLVPVLPSDGTCCDGGPDVLLFGPFPVSSTLAVCAVGFGAWLERTVLRLTVGFAVADLCLGAGRFLGASTCTEGSVVGASWASANAGINTDNEMQKNPA